MSQAIVKHQGGELFNVSMERFDGAYKFAHTLAASGMFPDAKTAERACVKIMAGMEMGIAPMAAMTGIHVIETGGQVSITAGANLMAQCIKSHPDYDYEVTEFSSSRCEIQFFGSSGSGRIDIGISDFDLDDAKAAGVSFKTKNGAPTNWTKFPRNMLFARAMSNGFKWYCPDAIGGLRIYTPDEVGAPTDDEGELDISKAVFVNAKIEKPVDERTPLLQEQFMDLMTWASHDGIIEEQVFESAQEWKDSATHPQLEKKIAEWEKKRQLWNDVNCPQLLSALGGDAEFQRITLLYISGKLLRDDYMATFNEMKAIMDGDAPSEFDVAAGPTSEDAAISTAEKISETQMMLDEKDDDSVIGKALWTNICALGAMSGKQIMVGQKIRSEWHKLEGEDYEPNKTDSEAPAAAVREAFKIVVDALAAKAEAKS